MKEIYKWLLVLATIIIAMTLIGCPVQPQPIAPGPDGTDDIADCGPACDHVEYLGCPEGRDLVFPGSCEASEDCSDGQCRDGRCVETCVMVCEAFVNQKRYLGLACWQDITECDQIESVCR